MKTLRHIALENYRAKEDKTQSFFLSLPKQKAHAKDKYLKMWKREILRRQSAICDLELNRIARAGESLINQMEIALFDR